jgi:hypothetical protein
VTVHARGYRPYAGLFGGPPAWWVILQANVAAVRATKAMRVLTILLLIIACCVGLLLYAQIGIGEKFVGRRGGQATPGALVESGRTALLVALRVYYTAATTVVSLLAILTGAGLVADDLRARALTLLMVRPIRAVDYALGKALLLPWILLTRAAAPGLILWLLAGAWQQPGDTQAFWEATQNVPWAVGTHLLLCAGGYAGLTLLVSAGTSRRGVASALAAAVIFGGFVLRGIGLFREGTAGELLRLASLPTNVLGPILRAQWETGSGKRFEKLLDWLPDATGAALVAGGLFLLGFLRVWKRARSVEVSE